MKTLVSALLALWLLSACNTVEDMRDMLDTQTETQELIYEQIGVRPEVGFNLNNGSLEHVSIAFSADHVANRSVSKLKDVSRQAIKKAFKETPKAIYVQLYFTAED